MSVSTKRRAKPDRYFELIQHFPLRPIRSDKELEQAMAMLDALIDRENLDPGEKDYLDVLSDQVERYEEGHVRIPPASDAEMLRHLVEAKQVTQAQVAQNTGIAESTISEVLAGRRRLNRAHIGKLARYFNVEPGAFTFA